MAVGAEVNIEAPTGVCAIGDGLPIGVEAGIATLPPSPKEKD